MIKHTSKALLTALVLATLSLSVSAQNYNEDNDAGDNPQSASSTVSGTSPGGSALTSISGVLRSVTDADVFIINIDDPANFSVTTVGLSLVDTQLFLFSLDGRAIYTNDDATGFTLQSTLPSGSSFGPMVAGLYLLGISPGLLDPIDTNGQLVFQDPPDGDTTAVRGPRTGAGNLGGFLNGGAQDSGQYSMNITGASAAVPEPSSVALVACGAGLLFAGIRARRRSRTE